jgi:mono/diheme cytochrome c family protein
MANCDVRFIPRDIPKDVFLKMCSLNQAENLDNIDDYAPVVPPPKVEVKPILPPVKPEPKPAPEPRNPDPPKGGNAGGGAGSNFMAALSNNCAKCHTGARAKGKNIIFNDEGSLNQNVSKDAIAKALADGKMPPKGQQRPSQDDISAIQNWAKGGN